MRTETTMSDAITFCVTAPACQVERVVAAAAKRLRPTSQWTAWRIFAADIQEEADELVRLNIFVDPVDGSRQPMTQVFEFYLRAGQGQYSDRFGSFLRAVGIVEKIEDSREMEGRYFATRNGGRVATDFGPLSMAL